MTGQMLALDGGQHLELQRPPRPDAAQMTDDAPAQRRGGHPRLRQDPADLARRLPHDRCGGRGHLRRQGPQPQGARHQLHAPRRPRGAPAADDRGDRTRWSSSAPRPRPRRCCSRPTSSSGCSPRFNVLLRDDKSFPYILIATEHEAPELMKHRGIAPQEGPLLRPLRLGARGQAHHHLAAARLPPPHLLGQLLQGPHPPLHAAPDQALLRPPAPARSRSPTTSELVEEARQFLSGKSQDRAGPSRDRHERTPPTRSTSSAPPSSATASPRWRWSRARATSPPTASRKPTSSPSTRKAASSASRSSSSAPSRTGATTPSARAPTPRSPRPKCSRPSSASSTKTARRRASSSLSHELDEHALIEEALTTRAGSRVYVEIPQARRKARPRQSRPQQRPRGARPPARRRRHAAHPARGRRRTASASTKPPRRIEVYDNSHISGTNAVGAMIVAGEEGFSQEALPHLQHQIDRHHPRRRLRHDARSPDPPLLPPRRRERHRGRGRADRHARLARRRLHRRRPGPAQRRARGHRRAQPASRR